MFSFFNEHRHLRFFLSISFSTLFCLYYNRHRLLDYSIASIRQQQNENDEEENEANINSCTSFRTLSNEHILHQHGLHLFRVPT